MNTIIQGTDPRITISGLTDVLGKIGITLPETVTVTPETVTVPDPDTAEIVDAIQAAAVTRLPIRRFSASSRPALSPGAGTWISSNRRHARTSGPRSRTRSTRSTIRSTPFSTPLPVSLRLSCPS